MKNKECHKLKTVMKNLFTLLISLSLLVSCSQTKTDNLQWYEDQVIEQVIADSDSTYIIQIGMMAQAFHLDKQNENFESNLNLLQESLSNKRKITIGVEKGSAKIISVKK
ncbi:hypothetical protein [Solitalea canadensis]|uniref:Uncharacterized protein n=1 Tax=Solitalea canadensis (strain ATCC 29591 / DSM 3403 / JCM 21819 / LMG 8368 / NBRC 15130 / NCIMB 12057 / USAM 9D) TaxID=929556 RepID=H8KQF6_SOLCM|nr:hypothetical protein [Solitalea canadensis]AFD06572.1 hypothetical protein Solca_1497 [Solitalea canadensis DSM 3403]